MRHALLLSLAVLLAFPTAAQDEAEYAITAEEEAAYVLIQYPVQFVKAREAAEAILDRHPDSFVALHVLAYVEERGEANLPRAYFLASKARSLLERRWGLDISSDGPWRWHARVLRQLISITRQMDREREALELLALRDRYYDPDLTVEYGWPLMKLGRMNEARAKMAAALQSEDPETRLTALNTWGAIEDEAGNAEESYRIFERLVEEARAFPQLMDATFLRNLGEAAEKLGRFDEAERHYREAVAYFEGGSFSNPWEDLSILYWRQCRFPEALAAVREMHAWAHANPPHLDQQSWADRQSITAALLAEAGFVTEGLDLARRIARRPDRRAGTSVHRDQSEAGQLLLLWSLARLEQERLAEEASWTPLWQRLPIAGRRLSLARESWAVGRRAAALTVGKGRLAPSLRFFASNGIDALPWLTPDLVTLVGPGLVEAEAVRLLARTDPAGLRERPYLLLVAGESQRARGSLREARLALEEALATLPRSELLLQARASALLGDIAWREGRLSTALADYQQALAHRPGILRTLGLALPIHITAAGDAASRKAASWLASSRRFERHPGGFTLEIGPAASRHRATLVAPDGTVLAEALVATQADREATARALCEELHHRAFALPLDLSQTDVNSLQGGTLSGNTLRRQLSDILRRP
ncbi:MAG: tetratricopeptide repeat protein [Thermoanaerobaculaceae bacterium]|nr:tetratricopeptide repeat protein [Thermoanaerobaculaceae bacterium]MDI9621373.1 tetratricopeptide repeat protein [Acidobacteriota bacterium]NLH10350.1 tetratricopeptide repeat protein [Holophagae bacterium]HPW56283.1 tetratricopeptide repeat protein [Thermoanaerobaculaceae bacterium]